MQAIVYTRYGSPDVLQLEEISKPIPKDDEVLVKVHASSINSADLDYLKGTFLIRLGGFQKPSHKILGTDIAGRVEAIGKTVQHIQVGDEVYGDLTEYGLGAFAEYVSVPEDALAYKPNNLSFEEAAAIPTAGIIALQALRDTGKIHAGQKVLINGAGGGVGTLAIQLAKHYDAEVTGVDSKGKLEMLRSLGADYVIDYAQEDFTKSGKRYDLIIDVVAYRSIYDYKAALTPDGIYGMIGGTMKSMLQAFVIGRRISQQSAMNMGMVIVRPKKDDLDFLRDFLETGTITPIIDRQYPLREMAEAMRYLESGQAQGKVVITMEDA